MAQVPLDQEAQEALDFQAAQDAAGEAVRAAREEAGRTLTDEEIRQAAERALVESDDPDIQRFGGVSGIELDEPPTVVPLVPVRDFVTRQALSLAMSILTERIREGEAEVVMVERRLGQAIQNVAGLLAEARVELLSRIEDSAQEEREIRLSQFAALQSAVTTRLSEIQDRTERLEEVAQEESGFSFVGLVRSAGGFVRSPFDWFIERAAGQILGEVRDGLNR